MASLLRPLLAVAALGAAVGALALPAHASNDRDFLKKALIADNSEIALGRIAQQRAAFQQTRDFGKMLTTDHAAAKTKALAVARDHGVPNTEALAPDARAEARKLERLRGPRFDREFARYMVKDHKDDIAEFEQQVRRGDRATAELARQTLPDLHRHLETAQALAR
ncbi:MAG TPA: DUF4142 domain-containing protein [Caulobacteraceae bacterium]|jgi:putative membrane protein|nr:DUF4142 domain-containing protein [Caulobacteraceae bacterium]